MISSLFLPTDSWNLTHAGRTPPTGNPGYVPPDALARIGKLTNLLKIRGEQRLALSKGAAVLDVGCGVGIDTLRLARAVGSEGCVTGVDFDPAMIAQAGEIARSSGLETRVRLLQADARALPFPDDVLSLFDQAAEPISAEVHGEDLGEDRFELRFAQRPRSISFGYGIEGRIRQFNYTITFERASGARLVYRGKLNHPDHPDLEIATTTLSPR